jgi:hypothetical protein
MDFREIEWDSMNWMSLKFGVTFVNLRVPQIVGKFQSN